MPSVTAVGTRLSSRGFGARKARSQLDGAQSVSARVGAMPCPFNTKSAADHFLQFRAVDELDDSQSANGNNEAWSQDFDFIIHPRRAVANLVRSGDAICAARIFSGKTAADCCEINF